MIYKNYNKKSFKKRVTKHIIEKVLEISKKNKLFLTKKEYPSKISMFSEE
jgi:hypothetical protein